MEGYRNSFEHLFDEIRRIDLLINVQVLRQRHEPSYTDFNRFKGLFISEEEIDGILQESLIKNQVNTDQVEPDLDRFHSVVAELERNIASKTAAARENGIHLPLLELTKIFKLSPFDIDALLICVAPELDLKYEKLYAYLQNDVTRKRPSVDLTLNLLCRSIEEKLRARSRLTIEAPLIKHQLLRVSNNGTAESSGWIGRPLKIDHHILNYILGVDAVDDQLLTFSRWIIPRASMEELLLPHELKENLVSFFQSELITLKQTALSNGPVFLIDGPEGVGKKFTAEALCKLMGIKLLVCDVSLLMSQGANFTFNLQRLLREARLRSAAIYFDHAEFFIQENEKVVNNRQLLIKALQNFQGIVFVGSDQLWDTLSEAETELFYKVSIPAPHFSDREQIWRNFLVEINQHIANNIDIGAIADKFRFTAGRIRKAIIEAQSFAMMRDREHYEITTDDLHRSCHLQSSSKLATLGKKITPIYSWNDIILPDPTLRQLKEICTHAKYRQQVFGQWGFDRKISLGKGLSALFIGASGTGKTMAAEIIAGELALELYKIDLSCVVSKYIGETEKNLNTIFQEAEKSNAILFFDEADAIFGKRSEVKDSHDRYANIEINYLLQRIEDFEGILILASNFHKNIDEAFTRRLRFIIEIPFPEKQYRYQIWTNIFPLETPLGNDIDYEFLSKKLKLAGGNIRNIALNAAFMAVVNSGSVRMEHIIRSTKLEFQKMGRVCVKADFEQYYDWVEAYS